MGAAVSTCRGTGGWALARGLQLSCSFKSMLVSVALQLEHALCAALMSVPQAGGLAWIPRRYRTAARGLFPRPHTRLDQPELPLTWNAAWLLAIWFAAYWNPWLSVALVLCFSTPRLSGEHKPLLASSSSSAPAMICFEVPRCWSVRTPRWAQLLFAVRVLNHLISQLSITGMYCT